MIANLKTTSAAEVGALSRTVVSFSARRNNHAALADILDENLRDMSSILFEICLIGRGRAAGVLRKHR